MTMMIHYKHRLMFRITTLAACLMFSPVQAEEVAVAAEVQFVVGNVTSISPGGAHRRLKMGGRIYSGDTVKSGPNGSARLIYTDQSRMAVRVNTTFTIVEYQYDTEDKNKSRSFFSLISGALRSITGEIGKQEKENVIIKTPGCSDWYSWYRP